MRLNDDLSHPSWVFAKGWLFLALACLASAGVLVQSFSWTTAACLAIALWASARWYYFMFYVIEKYVDPGFRFAGLGSFLRYVLDRRSKTR